MNTEEQKQNERLCSEWGLRKTRARLFIFDALSRASRPLSIPEMLQEVKQRKLSLNKTTLYREVESLVMRGVLQAVQLSHKMISYELSAQEHHHHFVCTSCNAVSDVVFAEGSVKKTEEALRKAGVQVTHHTLEFFGLCKTCVL